MSIGRIEIFTDEPEITSKNVIPVLRNALPKQLINANKCTYLLRYEAGEQPIKRVKKYRPDIDVRAVDNVANEVTEFKLGFNWLPMTLVQRGERDSGKTNESLSISLLNECYEAEEIKTKTQQLARFVEITGIGFTYIDINTEYQDGDSYFTLNVLDPRYAFVVRSNYYPDHRVVLGVSYREDDMGNRHFTCFTKRQRFEISGSMKITNGKIEKDKKGEPVTEWIENEKSGEMNPLGEIPIVEWIRSYDRKGCFERQIPEMDNLNLLISDFSNDVDQNTQAIFHTNDIEFPKGNDGEEQHPKTNDWVSTFTTQDGKTPFIKPIAISYDYQGMLNNILTKRALILQKCDVPQRSDNSGGSTGLGMDSANGYKAAEIAFNKQQSIMESCKMREVRVALQAIKKNPYIESDNPMLTLRSIDLQASIKRQRDAELTTKVNFFATAVSHGINGLHALRAMNVFEDVNQTWEDSREMIEAYQKSIIEKGNTNNKAVGGQGENAPDADRMQQDYSDQKENSPEIDGTETGKAS